MCFNSITNKLAHVGLVLHINGKYTQNTNNVGLKKRLEKWIFIKGSKTRPFSLTKL